MNIYLLIMIIFSYLYGSIPFALVIGKLFYGVDVREYGSGNLGGTNTGRILGKKAGLTCIILDILKCFVCVAVTKLVTPVFHLANYAIYVSAVACVIGHCYPIFAKFKGGKAASVMFGYAFANSFFTFAVIGIIFLVILKISKYVSLASIVAVISLVILSPLFNYGTFGFICNIFIALLLIYRHRENIKRIKDGTERKITWM